MTARFSLIQEKPRGHRPRLQWLFFFFFQTPVSHRICDFLQEWYGFLPPDASIRDALAVDEFFAWEQVLAPPFQVTFDHHADDSLITSGNLFGDILSDFDLAQVVLLTVGVAQINHHSLGETCGGQFFACDVHAGSIIIGLFSATQNDVAVLISQCRYDGGMPCLGDGQKMMWMSRGPNGVDGNLQTTIRPVLKPHRTGQTGGEFAMHLAFGRARAYGAPTDNICYVLRRDDVQILHTGGNPGVIQFEQ